MSIPHFVLIDYENTQPHDLHLLKPGQYILKLFLGPQQNSLPVEFIEALRAVDANYACIIMQTKGKNALDFHIAYQLGVLSCQHPHARYSIVSKDKGFDPLIRTLNASQIKSQRVDNIAAICPSAPSKKAVPQLSFEVAAATLNKLKHIPTSKKALMNVLKSGKNIQLSESELEHVHTHLCQQGIIRYDGQKPILRHSAPD